MNTFKKFSKIRIIFFLKLLYFSNKEISQDSKRVSFI